MSSRAAFTLRMYESELNAIERRVLEYENIETGGDLFGLWTRSGDPVIQLIIGAGEKCQRSSVSFHQDVKYLQNVGTFLNTSFMLCHIGSWHSHHLLTLTQPSVGDHSTVRNNFPVGLEKYIMIIANITVRRRGTGEDVKTVHLHPYMFSCGGEVCESGDVYCIGGPSPFREMTQVCNKIVVGEEKQRRNSRSRDHRATQKYRDQSSSHQAHGHGISRKEDEQWYNTSAGQEKVKSIHQGILEILRHENADVIQHDNSDERILFSRNSNTEDLILKFHLNRRKWEVQFPKRFDEENARVFRWSSVGPEPLTEISSTASLIQFIWCSCRCVTCKTLQSSRNISTNGRCVGDKTEQKEIIYKERWEDSCRNISEVKDELETDVDREESWTVRSGERNGVRLSTPIRNETKLEETRGISGSKKESEERPGIRVSESEESDEEMMSTASYDGDGEQSLTWENKTSFEGSPEINENAQRLRSNVPYSDIRDTNQWQRDEIETATKEGNLPHPREEIQQWYESDEGRQKLITIHENINSKFQPTEDVEFTWGKESKNIEISFHHNQCKWIVKFPRYFDREEAQIECFDRNSSDLSSVLSKDIAKDVQRLCSCQKCDDQKPTETISTYSEHEIQETTASTEFQESPHESEINNEQAVLKSSEHGGEDSPLSSSPSRPFSNARKKGTRKMQKHRKKVFNSANKHETKVQATLMRNRRRVTTAKRSCTPKQTGSNSMTSDSKDGRRSSSFSESSGTDTSRLTAQNLILNKVKSFTKLCINVDKKSQNVCFQHGQREWIIEFRKTFPGTPAKLYQRGDQGKSFFGNVGQEDFLSAVKDACRCQKCLGSLKCSREKGQQPYPRVSHRNFSADS